MDALDRHPLGIFQNFIQSMGEICLGIFPQYYFRFVLITYLTRRMFFQKVFFLFRRPHTKTSKWSVLRSVLEIFTKTEIIFLNIFGK